MICSSLSSFFSERDHTQKKVLNFPVNHVLIQHYRSGADYISDHSDKTIDVIRNSSIANVSLGAQRIMTLRLKRSKQQQQQEGERQATTTITALDNNSTTHIHQSPPRLTQRIPLPNNSLFIMGLETNRKWLHGISPDKRPLSTLSPSEQIYQGSRISLTFRWIGTYINPVNNTIWGMGARSKKHEDARKYIIMDKTPLSLSSENDNHGMKQFKKLIWAFGQENQDSEFDWDRWYGEGSDVVNFVPENKI